jgi:hypothetical protein
VRRDTTQLVRLLFFFFSFFPFADFPLTSTSLLLAPLLIVLNQCRWVRM